MKSNTGSWGDQGDGTYKNPILNADYPDVDVERVGDTYYMITSTMGYAPGMTILESKDLVNWSIIGHAFDKLEWEREYGWEEMGNYSYGVWAGDLAYNDGTWYCYQIDHQSGLYVTTAKDIRGPWTTPVCMLKKKNWTDPGVYFDRETHQAYLVCNFGRSPGGKDNHNETRLFKMSWDGLRLLDEGTVVYRGPGTEAAKIYKIKGQWFLLMAEWRDNDRKQLALRSSDIYGPYERRVIMERAPELDRSCCQGSLLEAVDGSWWLTHQLVQHRETGPDGVPGPSTDQSYEGRSQWLVPVAWKDGWPIAGVDRQGKGIGYTVSEHKKPIAGKPIQAPQTSDGFDSPALGLQWEWNHNPRDDRWSLAERPGWLRLKASKPVKDGGFWNAANTISQRLMGKGKGTATAKMDLSGMKPGQQAGFCHHSGQYILIGVKMRQDGTKVLAYNRDGQETIGVAVDANEIYFRTDMDKDQAKVSYGFDGKTWTPFGEQTFRMRFGRWRGDRLGFYCWNDLRDEGHVDIDWFRYDYNGPKGSGHKAP